MELRVHRGWNILPSLLDSVRALFEYGPGEDRATGYIYGDCDWPDGFPGDALLDQLEQTLGVRFTIALYQAYRNGTGCDWHTDDAFDAQAILSLGATRTFEIRRDGKHEWLNLADGDLVYMPPGFQQGSEHRVPVEDVAGERVSLVFRTVARN